MTSVPKPLKFLRPHYGTLKSYYETMGNSELKRYLADILSVLAMTMSAEGERESLKYRLLGSAGDIGSWGHEYVRNLAGEISQEYIKRQSEESPVDDLMELVQQIVGFHMKHNAEPEAVDLLMEVEDLKMLVEHVDSTNFKRTCLYLTSASRYLAGPDDISVHEIAYTIYLKFEEYANALQIALYLDNMQYVKQVVTSCDDLLRRKQFCYILGRYGIRFELDDETVADDDERDGLQEIINNSIYYYFRRLEPEVSMVAAKKRNRRANRNNGGYDYLSALPDSLIHHIFSLMPVKYIPRTCILSKRWRSTWVGTPDLVFHDLYILKGKRFRHYPKLVPSFVDSVLKHHHSSETTLNKFSINFKSRHKDLKDNKLGRSKVDSWLRYAADHRVKDLSLNMFRYRFRFPEFLYYNCPLLVKLDISCSRMICPENCIAWASLKSLTIRKALLSDDLVGKIFAGSPSLEFLELQSCYGVNQVEVVKSARLRELVIDSFRFPYGKVGVDASIFKISAPSLLVLRIRGVLYEKVLKLVQVPSVVEAELGFRMTGSNRSERVKVIGDAMKELSRASKVTVGYWCLIEYLARDDEQQHVEVVSALLEWKNVTLKSTYCQVSRVGTVRLLNGLQHVEKLVINFNPIIGFRGHAVDFAEDEVWSGHSFKHWDSNKCRSIEITVPFSNSDGTFSGKMKWLLALSKRLCPNGIVKVVRTEEAPNSPPPR